VSDFEVWGWGFELGLGFGPVWGLEWGDWFVCVRVCGVQLLCVLCQLLSCSMVVVFNCLCCVNCCSVQLSNVSNCCSVQLLCVVSVVVVFNCCSVQLCLFLLQFVFTSHVPICLQF